MKPIQTILVATDFSTPARHAVERAFRLAAPAGSELHILHGLELDTLDSLREMLGVNLDTVKAGMVDCAREQLKQTIEGPANPTGVTARAHVVIGNPINMIAAEAVALNTDLVVLGARGESILRHAMLGSTAARLLRRSGRYPVLVVKQPPRRAYRSVLVAVDFSPVSVEAIRSTKQLAPKADLFLLHALELPYEGKLRFAGVDSDVIHRHIRTEQEQRRNQLHRLADAAGLQPEEYVATVVHGAPSQQIVAQERGCDLIVLGKHGTHFTEELLLGSVTKHVLAGSRCDVLVVCDSLREQGQSSRGSETS